MGLFNGGTSFVVGFAAGFGTGVLVRDYVPNLKTAVSPALKFILKSGILTAERSREGLARFGETLQDLLAEAQMELKERKMGPPRKRKKGAVGKRSRAHAHAHAMRRKSRPAPVVKEAEVIPMHKGRAST